MRKTFITLLIIILINIAVGTILLFFTENGLLNFDFAEETPLFQALGGDYDNTRGI